MLGSAFRLRRVGVFDVFARGLLRSLRRRPATGTATGAGVGLLAAAVRVRDRFNAASRSNSGGPTSASGSSVPIGGPSVVRWTQPSVPTGRPHVDVAGVPIEDLDLVVLLELADLLAPDLVRAVHQAHDAIADEASLRPLGRRAVERELVRRHPPGRDRSRHGPLAATAGASAGSTLLR